MGNIINIKQGLVNVPMLHITQRKRGYNFQQIFVTTPRFIGDISFPTDICYGDVRQIHTNPVGTSIPSPVKNASIWAILGRSAMKWMETPWHRPGPIQQSSIVVCIGKYRKTIFNFFDTTRFACSNMFKSETLPYISCSIRFVQSIPHLLKTLNQEHIVLLQKPSTNSYQKSSFAPEKKQNSPVCRQILWFFPGTNNSLAPRARRWSVHSKWQPISGSTSWAAPETMGKWLLNKQNMVILWGLELIYAS